MSFQDIKGQDRPIRILREYLKHSRLTGSYLFTGQEGIGKKLTAKMLAKAVNCQSSDIDCCDACPSCLKIEKKQHPDIHIIESTDSQNRGLDQKSLIEESDSLKIEYIRQLQREISLKPYEGKTKVFIIDNAHSLTPDAANSLLKILEEPPAQSLIILISAKPALLFKTILSRCKIIKFYPLEREKLEDFLKENFHLDNDLAHYLAFFCEGRIGQALRLKDADALRQRDRIIDAFTSRHRQGPDRVTAETRYESRVQLNILASWFRDMYMVKIGMPEGQLINLDRRDELSKAIERYAFTDLYDVFNSISRSLFYLERNINPKLLLSNLKWSFKTGA